MVKEIIGDIEIFAIEYRISDSSNSMGNLVIYIGGHRIGFFDEESYLSAVFVNIKKCFARKPYFEELLKHGEIELEDWFRNSNDSKYDTTFISFGDTFDDFLVRGFYVGNKCFRIVFKLLEDSFYNYEDLDNRLYYFDLDSDYVIDTINEFELKVKL